MNYSYNPNKIFDILAFRDQQQLVEFSNLEPVKYKNIYISHSGLALEGFKPVEITFFNNISLQRKKSLVRYTRIKKLLEKKITGVRNAAFIHHIWSNGYHHWLCECLLKATYLNPAEVNLYVPEEYPRFAFESLELLGFKAIYKIPVKTGVKCKEALLIPNPTSGHFQKSDLMRIKNAFLNKIKSNSENQKRKIFISRKKAGLRKIKNEDEFIPILKDFNYEIIYAEDLSFKDQVLLFQECQVLISIHGAGLTNCIFMPENSFVFEIYREMKDEKDVMNLCYYRMTKALDLNYMVQFSQVANSKLDLPEDRQDILVNVEEFKKNINLIEHKIK